MQDINFFIKENNIKKLLAIFPHPDDESYVSGGLFQVLHNFEVNTKLICLTKGKKGKNFLKKGDLGKIREQELKNASKILRPDAGLKNCVKEWRGLLIKKIINYEPQVVLTFDYSGITGHPDHIVTCDEVLKIIKSLKKRPILIWRVPNGKEKKYFFENESLKYSVKPNLLVNYSFFISANKIKAIFSHQSQIKNFQFKLHIIDWFFFDHQEPYYKVDLKKNYEFEYVHYKIN